MQESLKSHHSIDLSRPSRESCHKPLEEDDPNSVSDTLQPTQVRYTEPYTHLKNKSFGEKYCGSICCVNRTKLSHDELVAYYKLRDTAKILIPKDFEEFDYLFKRLWGNLSSEPLENIVDKRWESFGFQNQNPRSDIRGGGLLALNHLIYYTHGFKNQVVDMCKPANVFLFASSSINVTFFLIKYYHLTDDITFPRDKKEIASRKALKSMCSILEEDEEAFNKVYAILMTDLFEVWSDMLKANPNLTLMDFPKAFNIIKKKYHKATRKLLTNDLGRIVTAYKNVKSKVK